MLKIGNSMFMMYVVIHFFVPINFYEKGYLKVFSSLKPRFCCLNEAVNV